MMLQLRPSSFRERHAHQSYAVGKLRVYLLCLENFGDLSRLRAFWCALGLHVTSHPHRTILSAHPVTTCHLHVAAPFGTALLSGVSRPGARWRTTIPICFLWFHEIVGPLGRVGHWNCQGPIERWWIQGGAQKQERQDRRTASCECCECCECSMYPKLSK